MSDDLVHPFNPIDAIDTTKDIPIHIRLAQRTGRKSVTIVEGYSFTAKEITTLKKQFCCGGYTDEKETVFNGDVRSKVQAWLHEKGYCRVMMHGWD